MEIVHLLVRMSLIQLYCRNWARVTSIKRVQTYDLKLNHCCFKWFLITSRDSNKNPSSAIIFIIVDAVKDVLSTCGNDKQEAHFKSFTNLLMETSILPSVSTKRKCSFKGYLFYQTRTFLFNWSKLSHLWVCVIIFTLITPTCLKKILPGRRVFKIASSVTKS